MDRPPAAQPATDRLTSFRGLAAAIGLACLALVVGCVMVLLEGRADLVRRWDRLAGNILVLAEQAVKVEISRYDLRLQDLASDIEMASSLSTTLPNVDSLFGGEAERDSTGDVIIVDQDGKVVTSSRPGLTRLYIDSLPSILQTTRFNRNGLGISGVVKARPHEAEIALVRRAQNLSTHSTFSIIAMLPMSWIQGVFSDIELGPHGTIGLVDSDHVLLARKPYIADRICTRIWTQEDLTRPSDQEILRAVNVSKIDGIRRRITASRVGSFPLFVFVGIAPQDIFAGWGKAAAVLLLSILFLIAVVVALMVAVVRQLHRKMQTDRRLVELNTQLEELARTDQLTGLLNRRGFDENLAREWRRCRRSGRPISLLMLDADFFKQYNDHYGHQAGDSVLQMLARCIEENIRRPGDIAARYGGEEFAVVLPDTDAPGAARVAANIVAGLAMRDIRHAPGHGAITTSIGIGYALPGAQGAAHDLVAVADAALYESKTSGRNRTTMRALEARPAA